jgi:acyl-coenzyme A synthetase/AMP-(fatty) acid ligase
MWKSNVVPAQTIYRRNRPMADFVDMIAFHSKATPDKPAIMTGAAAATYEMLHTAMCVAEARLYAMGFRPGQTLAISLINPLGHLALVAAMHRMGIASITIDKPQLPLVANIAADAVLAEEAFDCAVRVHVVDETWFKSTGALPAPRPRVEMPATALCRLVMSSGTTGVSKTIALSYQATMERQETYALRTSTPGWERLICMPGLSTNYGYSFAITTFYLGRTIGFAFEANARQMILGRQADLLVASTHQIAMMVRYQDENFMRLDSLRAVHIGGSIAYAPLLAKIRMLVCNNVICGYGSTEGGTVAFSPAEPMLGIDCAVGLVAPWIDVRVTAGDGTEVEAGEPGEIRIKAMGQGYRYTKNDDGTASIADDEWFRPGDQGVVFRNGLMLVTGRLNEIINRGGVKVAPDAIEEEVRRHPGIADVAAVGMLDGIGLEQIWIAVVGKGNREVEVPKFYEWCRANIPSYIPDRVFEVSEIPRNRLGKVSRETLKEQLKALELATTGAA